MNDVSTPVREVQVKLFGAFRQFHREPVLTLEVPPDTMVAHVRERVALMFDEDANAKMLLKASAFATDRRVLEENEAVPEDTELALLPPVCGG